MRSKHAKIAIPVLSTLRDGSHMSQQCKTNTCSTRDAHLLFETNIVSDVREHKGVSDRVAYEASESSPHAIDDGYAFIIPNTRVWPRAWVVMMQPAGCCIAVPNVMLDAEGPS